MYAFDTGGCQPVFRKPHPILHSHTEDFDKQIDHLVENGIIPPSKSLRKAPVIFVKNGSVRLVNKKQQLREEDHENSRTESARSFTGQTFTATYPCTQRIARYANNANQQANPQRHRGYPFRSRTMMIKDYDGYRYLLLIGDLFSKYIVAVPHHEQTAEDICLPLHREWLQVHGIPNFLIREATWMVK